MFNSDKDGIVSFLAFAREKLRNRKAIDLNVFWMERACRNSATQNIDLG